MSGYKQYNPSSRYADAQDQQMWRAVTSSRVVTLCDRGNSRQQFSLDIVPALD